MKKKLSILSILLAAVMLFTMLPLSATADVSEYERNNGPLTPDINPFGAQFTFLRLNELDEEGKTIQNEDYTYKGYCLYGNYWNEEAGVWESEVDEDLPAGVAYDLATNTLTLTGFDGSGYMLSANMMGDDFTLCVEGDCKLGVIYVWGDSWGAGLKIAGSGTLTVNENKLFEYAVEFHPEYTLVTFRLDDDASVKLYGTKSPVGILGTEQTEDLFDLPDSAEAEPVKENLVRNEPKWLFGYTVDEEYVFTSYWTQATCRDDPDGIYTIGETTYYPGGLDDESSAYKMIDVHHYYYSEKYDIHCEDYDFGDEDGNGTLSFSSYEDAKAAGYEPKLDENGDEVGIEIRTGGGSGSDQVVIGPDGKEYVGAWTKRGEGDYGDILAEIEPLPGVEDTYLFIVRRDLIDIDPDDLETVRVDVEYDDMFMYTLPGTELVYEGVADVTEEPTTAEPTTAESTTAEPTTAEPTTAEPTTAEPTTAEPTTAEPTTAEPTTAEPTTAEPTTAEPTTEEPTTEAPKTEAPTTEAPKTEAPTTEAPKTEAPTTEAPKTEPTVTEAPKTEPPVTDEPTTEKPSETEPVKGFTLGDVNKDGNVNAKDARLALRAAAKLETLDELQAKLADVTEDGKVKAGDARMILRIAAKLEPKPTKMFA